MAYRSKLEKIEKEQIQKNRIIYRAPCRVGNWFEDKALLEETTAFSNYKADRCSLLIQKTRKMLRNTMKTTSLAADTEFVRYGYNYLIKALDAPNYLTAENRAKGDVQGLYLAGAITENEIDYIQDFVHGCSLSASISKVPCVRNTFKLVGCDSDKRGQAVLYGTDLYIQIAESSHSLPLYLRCCNSTMSTIGTDREFFLSQVPDSQCRFRILHWVPDLRWESCDSAVTPGARVIIKHSASGQNLAVEFENLIPTLFGFECKVLCKDYKDTHKMEQAENFWSFNGIEILNKNMIVRAARGDKIRDSDLE